MALGAVWAAPPDSVNIDSSLHAFGQHVLRAGAADAAGNQSAWAELTGQFGGTRTQPAAVTHIDNAVAGLSLATAVAQAPDASLFVALQGGG